MSLQFKPVYGKTVVLSESTDPWYTVDDNHQDEDETAPLSQLMDAKEDEISVRIRDIKRMCKQATILLIMVAAVVVVYKLYKRKSGGTGATN